MRRIALVAVTLGALGWITADAHARGPRHGHHAGHHHVHHGHHVHGHVHSFHHVPHYAYRAYHFRPYHYGRHYYTRPYAYYRGPIYPSPYYGPRLGYPVYSFSHSLPGVSYYIGY